MGKIFLIVFGFLGVGFVYLFIAGMGVQEISSEIEIKASPEQVWSTLMDFDKWQEWSPIIKKSSGSAVLGETLQMTMMGKEPGKNGPSYNPQIKEMKKPQFFRWRAHMIAGFIMTNDKVFELEATTTGTKLIHKELFKGLLAPIFCTNMEKGVLPMLNSMNQALKERLEN